MKHLKLQQDVVAMIETNVDDISGEVVSRAIERILSQGAEDAYATFYLGKKARPGINLKVICRKKLVPKLVDLVIQETGTLGVKLSEHKRLIVPRRIVQIPIKLEGYEGNAPVKVSYQDGKILRLKPEFEDARGLAEVLRIPLREVVESVSDQARAYFSVNKYRHGMAHSKFSVHSAATKRRRRSDGSR